jgi:hypothetical protein
MKKSELLTQLNNQIDCVFTLAQVKTLIEGLENETTNTFDVDKVYKDIQSCIQKEIERIDDSDLVDDDDIDFSVSYKEICIDSINVDYSPISNAIREGLDEWKNSLESSNG